MWSTLTGTAGGRRVESDAKVVLTEGEGGAPGKRGNGDEVGGTADILRRWDCGDERERSQHENDKRRGRKREGDATNDKVRLVKLSGVRAVGSLIVAVL